MEITEILRRVRNSAAIVSPRRRRWLRFLRDLPLDPDQPTSTDSPGTRDFIICGCPRTGTTLACAMLYQPPRVVTVMEPWDGMRLPPAALFASLREEIATTERLRRGRLDVGVLEREGRIEWSHEGEDIVSLDVGPDYLLGVKWPGYWRYLDLLPTTKFVVCVRDPMEVVASFKKAGGRLAQGLNYDTSFNRSMNAVLLAATANEAKRRVLLFDYVHSRLLDALSRPNVFVLRYERWFVDREGVMADLSAFLGVPLGAGLPILRPPRSDSALSAADRELIRQYCTTAPVLGYPLAAAFANQR